MNYPIVAHELDASYLSHSILLFEDFFWDHFWRISNLTESLLEVIFSFKSSFNFFRVKRRLFCQIWADFGVLCIHFLSFLAILCKINRLDLGQIRTWVVIVHGKLDDHADLQCVRSYLMFKTLDSWHPVWQVKKWPSSGLQN